MNEWYIYGDAETQPVFTEGMCPARPKTGPDGAFAVYSSWDYDMGSLVKGLSCLLC